jgi:hypothetical protein
VLCATKRAIGATMKIQTIISKEDELDALLSMVRQVLIMNKEKKRCLITIDGNENNILEYSRQFDEDSGQ